MEKHGSTKREAIPITPNAKRSRCPVLLSHRLFQNSVLFRFFVFRSGMPFRPVKDCRVGRKKLRPPRNDKNGRFFVKTYHFCNKNIEFVAERHRNVPRWGTASRKRQLALHLREQASRGQRPHFTLNPSRSDTTIIHFSVFRIHFIRKRHFTRRIFHLANGCTSLRSPASPRPRPVQSLLRENMLSRRRNCSSETVIAAT